MKTAFKYTIEEMTTKEILQYAAKGLDAEIKEIKNQINEYNSFINARENGNRADKNPLSIEGLKSKVEELRVQKAKLKNKYDDIKWELKTEF